MTTITEDYVSFEVAKLLKEKGFNEETEYIFSNNGELLRLNHFGIKDLTNTDCNDYHTWQFPIEGVASIISAPTLQMAMKWLRKIYDIDISIIPLRSHKEYLPRIESDIISYDAIPCKEYEDACEAAILYCLENLI